MESIIRDQVVFYSYYASLMSGRWTWIQEERLTVYIWIWIWINNRQNLHWSITSMSVHRCLWHGAIYIWIYIYIYIYLFIYKRIQNSANSSTAANRIVTRLYTWTATSLAWKWSRSDVDCSLL